MIKETYISQFVLLQQNIIEHHRMGNLSKTETHCFTAVGAWNSNIKALAGLAILTWPKAEWQRQRRLIAPFYGSVNPTLEGRVLRPNHFSNVSSLNTVTMAVKFQYEF